MRFSLVLFFAFECWRARSANVSRGERSGKLLCRQGNCGCPQPGDFNGTCRAATPSPHRPRDEEPRWKIGGSDFGPLHPQRMRGLSLGLPSLVTKWASRQNLRGCVGQRTRSSLHCVQQKGRLYLHQLSEGLRLSLPQGRVFRRRVRSHKRPRCSTSCHAPVYSAPRTRVQ